MNNPINALFLRFSPQEWWKFMNMGALGVGSAFIMAILFTYNWGENALLLRVFSPKDISIGPGDHHTLIMLLLGVTFYLTIYLGVRPIFAVMGVYFLVEAHEAEWYVTYVASKFYFGGLFEWRWLEVLVLMVPIMFWYVYLFGFPWKFFGFMVPFYVGWFGLGFPITQDFPGRTSLFNDLSVNALEILSWVWAAVGFYYFVYPRLKKYSERYNMDWSKDFTPLVKFIRRALDKPAGVEEKKRSDN